MMPIRKPTLRRPLALACASVLLWIPSFSQDNFEEIHREDFTRWSQVTALSPTDVHLMWRATSHYAKESDDDSSIELLDITVLRSRQQILMITSAGIPRCITVAVFSAARGNQKLWQENQGPDNYGFCDNLGIPAAVNITKDGKIEVTTAVSPDDKDAAHAVTRTYLYQWNGSSYAWSASRDSSTPIRSQKK
jgi:hypothetical protein